MCDQTEVSYLDGDVVWVKMGPVWWPGVVTDLEKTEEGKEILAGLRKKPIASVKFFNEDNYEYVKNLDHIYHYNCRKKDEFIKKGLDKYRTGAEFMKKFPADVTTAEGLVNGDVNIINDPKFLPEEKQSYSEIFGSGKKKKKKDSDITPKTKSRPSPSTPSYRPITHQRFINKALHGESDHKIKTLIQPTASPEDSSRNKYKCHICKFETTRVNVIVAHNRLSHSSNQAVTWSSSDSQLMRKKPTYKARKPKSKKLFDSVDDEESNDTAYEEPKKKKSPAKTKASKDKKSETKVDGSPAAKSTSPGKRKANDDTSEAADQKKPRFTDALLADWSEDEDDEKGKMDDIENDELKETSEIKTKEESESKTEDVSLAEQPTKEAPGGIKKQSEKMSCFDFDEEEEGFIGMSNANTYGRKIPRVIPVKDKSDLGVDLEIEELFKRKSESDQEDVKNETDAGEDKNNADSLNETFDEDLNEDKSKEEDSDFKDESKTATGRKRGRKPKAKAEKKKLPEPPKVEDSLAMRRGRRAGARKSYLNEVIEKIEDQGSPANTEKKEFDQPDLDFSDQEIQSARVEVRRSTREEGSSRRKQDLKIHATSHVEDELIYPDTVKLDQKTKPETTERRGRKRSAEKSQSENENLTKEIDKLLTETSVPALPMSPHKKNDPALTEESTSNTLSLSFDYVPSEQSPKKVFGKQDKSKQEVKSISKLFSDSTVTIHGQESNAEESKNATESNTGSPQKEMSLTTSLVKGVTSPLLSPRKKVILSSIPKIIESSGSHVTVLPIIKTTSAASEGNCVILSSGKKVDLKKVITETKQELSDGGVEGARMKTIKTIKIKPEAIPQSLLASGKLKAGHTIIQQKGGKYVIVSPQSHTGQSKIIPGGKPATGNKVMIVTNQHGEQKIITTGGLKQSKLTQKILSPTETTDKSDAVTLTPGLTTVSKAQPIIKMVPDGKGGVMKTISVSPKKVLLGGTKVLVSPSSPQKEVIQKIALPAGGGDLRLIENYKGSGKTVIIQGSSCSGNVILKPSSGAPRQTVSRVIQTPQKILSLKKNPKIVMRTSGGQSEFVVHSGSVSSADTPTYVMKKQGPDGKFATQKIIRRPVVQAKASTSGSGPKTIYLSSGQVAAQKGESIILKSNQEPSVTNIVRLKPVVKDQESSTAKPIQKVVQKSSEIYTIPQNSYVLPAETMSEQTAAEVPQTVQVEEEAQQPVLQTQVVAMPGPIGADGNQTYVLVSVDEHGVVQTVDNSIIAYDIAAPQDQVYVNPTNTSNVILINNQPQEELTPPVYSTASQDILAEALANTNVLEGSISSEMESVMPSILLPPTIPSSVVQETSVTLQKPIMTPLEMPSSVQPDTSGLEPPPLPPTPTEEDVLMEEESGGNINTAASGGEIIQDTQQEESHMVTEEESGICTNVVTTETLTSDDQTVDHSSDQTYEETAYQEENKNENLDTTETTKTYVTEEGIALDQNNVIEYYQSDDYQEAKQQENVAPREDFIIENSQEDQGTSSFQSMPLLNDEPDTSDDAQGSEPIADQDFELQKSRMGNGDFSPLLRDQEPPSSTNNDIVTESNYESNEGYLNHQDIPTENTYREDDTSQEDETKEKDSSDNKTTQSMPLITDEGNINAYEIDPMYADVINQKRFHEETEVTSTTDEFANKDNVG